MGIYIEMYLVYANFFREILIIF